MDAASACGFVLASELRACGVDFSFTPVLDLDYDEDSACDTDMNVVMNDAGGFIEVQGTAEGHPMRRDEIDTLLELAAAGTSRLFELQRQALAQAL